MFLLGLGQIAQQFADGDIGGVGGGDTVDLGGMTLMPGLITCHFHPDFYKFTLPMGFAGDQLGKEFPPGVMMAMGVRQCGVLLESGFTGYVGASASNDIDANLKIAIAENIIQGPRIRACSHHIGTTADANDSKKWWQRFQHGPAVRLTRRRSRVLCIEPMEASPAEPCW